MVSDVGKHSAERRSALPLLLATAAVLGIAVTAFLLVRVFNGSQGSSTASSQTSPSSAVNSSPPSAPASSTSTSSPATATATGTATSAADIAAQAALKACVDHQSAAKGVVDAIATGAGHWSDHVQAETDLQAGRRTLIDVTTNTWGPTRSAGPQDVTTFQGAQGAFGGAPACSATAGSSPAPADVTPKLQACAAREAALDNVVAVGSKVMGDWQTHLTEMADHADGHINGLQAQANWLKRWAESRTNLDPYKTAVASLAAAPACTV